MQNLEPYEKFRYTLDDIHRPQVTTVPAKAIKYNNDFNLQWRNELAINRVYQTIKMTGQQPDMVNNSPGGRVIWFRPAPLNKKITSGNYVHIEIRDQVIVHEKPARHADFLFVALPMRMKPEKAADMQTNITNSFFYYGMGEEAYSICGEIEASIATFVIAKLFNDDIININRAVELYNYYVKQVLGEFFAAETHENINDQPFPIRDAYEEYLFSDSSVQSNSIRAGQELAFMMGKRM